jgi:ribosomal protein S18 acetylase RimI-like enzyme
MHTLRLAGAPYASPEQVVSGLLAVQAENRAQAEWAVATRARGVIERDVDRLLDDGAVLRTHVLRTTWHFVVPDDIRWLVELTAPGLRRTWRQLQQSLQVSDEQLDRARALVVDALTEDGPLTRARLGERLLEAGLPGEGQALGLVLGDAEQAALVCSGPGDTYALLAERAPAARRLGREEALAEIALRYLSGHGPATERDLAYWATLTVTDVRQGLAAVADRLQRTEHDGTTYWSAGGPPDDLRLEPRAHLLQVLDEAYRGYQHSRGLLDLAGIVPSGRLPDTGMVLVDGQMVGGMKRDVRDDEVRFHLRLYRDLDSSERQAVEDAADRYGAFLDRPARVAVRAAGR